MKVHAEIEKCEGYANCVVAAPRVFAIDDENIVLVRAPDPPEEERETVEEAVRSCPTAALSIEEA